MKMSTAYEPISAAGGKNRKNFFSFLSKMLDVMQRGSRCG